MTRAMRQRVLTHGLTRVAALLVSLAMSNRANAAVAQGPHYTNSVAAEEQRILQFFEAEQSFQDKLKVGRERYEQKQLSRSNIIAAMSAELQARQQTVAMEPVAASKRNTDELVSGSQPWLAVLSLAIGIVALGCFRNRQQPQDEFVRQRQGSSGLRRSREAAPNRKDPPRAAGQLTTQSTKNKSVRDLGTCSSITLSDGVKPRPIRYVIKSPTLP